MKALIIEDEQLAAKQLINILKEIENIEVVAIVDSIKSSINWFQSHNMPDLIFMDIHIADGTAFKIFEHVNIICPIIFTTAYDEYAIKAFNVNSIDYLLKPINQEAVEKSLAKLKRLSGSNINHELQKFILTLNKEKSYKTHFLVSVKGNKLVPLVTSEIAYFNIHSAKVNAVTHDNKQYLLDFTLDELAGKLNPADFFRANRQFIISKQTVKDVDFWFNNRLSINLQVPVPEKILISRTRVTEFKKWFAGDTIN